MTALSDFILARVSGRRVLLVLALLILCLAAFNLILTPRYQAVAAGFIPFDLQYPLSPESIVIQFGATSEGAVRAYVWFAALDAVFPLLGAVFFVLFWGWLVTASGSPALLAIYRSGWWIWGVFPCLVDWAENAAFLSLMLKRPAIDADLLLMAVDIHRAKFVFFAIAQAVTVALALTVLLVKAFRRKS